MTVRDLIVALSVEDQDAECFVFRGGAYDALLSVDGCAVPEYVATGGSAVFLTAEAE